MSDAADTRVPPHELGKLLVMSPEFSNMVLPAQYAEPTDWSDLQIGFRTQGRSGESLVSAEAGEWHPDWWVFATNAFADPFFVDLREADSGYPVRFATHGAGRWDSIDVADSVGDFLRVLDRLAALEDHPSDAAAFVETEMPSNEFWDEVSATYREDEG